MKNFKQLRVWQKGLEIALASYELVQAFPKEERYGLSSQITRAAVSIPSNIAEGSSRGSEKDYNRFLEISLGSCFELETQLRLIWEVIANFCSGGKCSVSLKHSTAMSNPFCQIFSSLKFLIH